MIKGMSTRAPDSKPRESARREPTLYGRRIGLSELNLGVEPKRGRWQRWLYAFSQFLAGMYTGESCAGTPHSERSTFRRDKDNAQAEPESEDSARDKRL